MNFHLAQIASIPYQIDALRHAGTHADSGLQVDTNRPVANRALGRRIARFLAYLGNLKRARDEQAQLLAMSDRDLADMGLTRGDIDRVHDQDFAADYATARATSQSLKWL